MCADSKHLIVIGGGAAGIYCAVNAARLCPGLRVTVLEKTGKLLSKVKVSGGGRCNVTHACFDITEMSGRYPRGGQFVRRELYRWGVTDTLSWFEERGVPLKTESDGRMFPVTDSSQTVIDCLLREVDRYGVEIRLHTEVKEVTGSAPADVMRSTPTGASADSGSYGVRLADGRTLHADYVCVACGGYPKSGMFDWIRRLGHTIEEPVPSLFTFNMPGDPITRLMGVAVASAQVKIVDTRIVERGPLLVTHWGLSGPVILRLSAWGARELAAGAYRFSIRVNWLPEWSDNQIRERMQLLRYEWAARLVGNGNPFALPQRFWEYCVAAAGIPEGLRWADLPAKDQNRLVNFLWTAEYAVAGKTTFKEEFVTAGGVRLAEVDPVSCQSRISAGLYFAGEVLDVDGITGGFNFQHAWSSGWIVADSVANASKQ
jgi:predicted Rossmann fold flavoprotein